MRVITGSAKHIPLISKDFRTVPLSDRAKSALFAIINSKIEGSEVLDLFAGSGALGIECLSRGASFATFIDISNRSIESIEENLAKTKLSEKADIFRIEADHYLKKYSFAAYDIIFVCPPYDSVHIHTVKLAANLVKPGGILIFEHHKKDTFKELETLKKVDERTYGIVRFEIYQNTANTPLKGSPLADHWGRLWLTTGVASG